MGRKRKYSDQELREAISNSLSWSQVITCLGLKVGGGTYTHLQSLAKVQEIDYSHFTGQGWNVGSRKRSINTNKRPIEAYLSNAFPIGSHNLKKRLWKEGLKQKVCELCGLMEWLDKPAPLELHHKDGNRVNNHFDNLQILCPNCHAFTDTFCGKNKG